VTFRSRSRSRGRWSCASAARLSDCSAWRATVLTVCGR
jgi:hypothetical protein